MCPELAFIWTKEVEYLGVKIGIAMQNIAKYSPASRTQLIDNEIDKLKRVLNPW